MYSAARSWGITYICVRPQLLAAEYIFICIEEYYMWEVQCGPVKDNSAMNNEALMLYYVFIGHI